MALTSVVIKSITKAFKEERENIRKAQSAALNRAIKTAVSRTIKLIREGYNLKAKDIRSETKITKATRNKLNVTVKVQDRAIPLIKFKARQTKRGVSAAQRKGNRSIYPSAFIAKTNKGDQTVYIRKTIKSLPVRQLFGPSAMQLFSSSVAQAQLSKVFYERFYIELERAIIHFSKGTS